MSRSTPRQFVGADGSRWDIEGLGPAEGVTLPERPDGLYHPPAAITAVTFH